MSLPALLTPCDNVAKQEGGLVGAHCFTVNVPLLALLTSCDNVAKQEGGLVGHIVLQ